MTPADLQKSIEDARRRYRMDFIAHRRMMIDFYEGNQHELDSYLKKWGFADMTTLPLTSDGLTRKVIDRISMVYKKPPIRKLDDMEDDGYNQFLNDHPRFDQTMAVLERYKNLLHNVLFRLHYDAERGAWRFYIETEYYPHYDEDNPFFPIGYSIPFGQDNMNPGKPTRTIYLYVSDDEYYFHGEHGEELMLPGLGTGGVNPYGIMPVIDFSPVPVDDYWSLGEKALVDKHRSLLIAELDVYYSLHLQAFDQAYATGIHPGDNNKIELGPNKVPVLPEDATLSLLGFNPKLTEATEVIERMTQRVLAHYGITNNTDDTGNALSGTALKIKNMELLERRESAVQEFRPKEKEIYKVWKAIAEYHNLYRTPDAAELTVDFAEIDFPSEPGEEREQWDWEWKNGISSKVDYLKAQNPDLDDEAAQKVLDKNATDNRGNRGVFTSLFEEQSAALAINERLNQQ